MMRCVGALVAAIGAASAALAADACLYQPPPIAGFVPADVVADYRSTFLACRKGEEKRIAIRNMAIGGAAWLLLVDPERLTTRIERADCWVCEPTDDAAQKATRYVAAVALSAEAPGLVHRGFLENAGLIHGAAPGAFVTGDLCPSRRPLDRHFFEKLAT